MRIRKHKGDKTFQIRWQEVHRGRKIRLSPTITSYRDGHSKEAVLKAFMFGRDSGAVNILSCHEVTV